VEFLERMGPDYKLATFINDTLGPETNHNAGNVIVFLRHLYYLKVPYVYGDPATSWTIDPSKYNKPDQLLLLLNDMNVRWVVRSPDYPAPLAEAFGGLESQNKLVRIASMDLETFTGNSRIYRQKRTVEVVILELQK
jgi:hypothetical protein